MKNTIPIMLMALTVTISSCNKEYLFIASGYTAENQYDIMLCALNHDGTYEILSGYNCGDNPSFFTSGKDGIFYLVNEADTFNMKAGGGITTLRVNGKNNTIEKLGSFNQGGPGPCHILLSDDGGYLITANYGSGSVSVIKLDEKGMPVEVTDVIKYGDKSHPHMTHYNKRTRLYYITDLGFDRVNILSLDTESGRLINANNPSIRSEQGAGPRHITADANDINLYVINELNSTISVYNMVPDVPELKQSVSTLPGGYNEKNSCADIHLSPDGRLLYASNRGHNSIAVFKRGNDGSITLQSHVSCGGSWPRNFTVSNDGKIILVGNQRSDSIAVFSSGRKGLSEEPISSIPFNGPACIRFLY